MAKSHPIRTRGASWASPKTTAMLFVTEEVRYAQMVMQSVATKRIALKRAMTVGVFAVGGQTVLAIPKNRTQYAAIVVEIVHRFGVIPVASSRNIIGGAGKKQILRVAQDDKSKRVAVMRVDSGVRVCPR